MQEGDKRMLVSKLDQCKIGGEFQKRTENQNNSGKQGKDFCTGRKT